MDGQKTQNKVIVFPKEIHNYKKGDYVMVKVNDCTQATLLVNYVIQFVHQR